MQICTPKVCAGPRRQRANRCTGLHGAALRASMPDPGWGRASLLPLRRRQARSRQRGRGNGYGKEDLSLTQTCMNWPGIKLLSTTAPWLLYHSKVWRGGKALAGALACIPSTSSLQPCAGRIPAWGRRRTPPKPGARPNAAVTRSSKTEAGAASVHVSVGRQALPISTVAPAKGMSRRRLPADPSRGNSSSLAQGAQAPPACRISSL